MLFNRQISAITSQEPPRDYAVARCIQAWGDLSTCRSVGWAVGAIPWDKIVAWCEFHGLDYEAAQILVHVIRTLDIEHAEARRAEDSKNNALGTGRGKGRR